MQHPILKDAKDALDKLSADPPRSRPPRPESELWFCEYGRVASRLAFARPVSRLFEHREDISSSRASWTSTWPLSGHCVSGSRLNPRVSGLACLPLSCLSGEKQREWFNA